MEKNSGIIKLSKKKKLILSIKLIFVKYVLLVKLAKTTYPSQVPSSLCFQAVLRMKLNLDATLNILAAQTLCPV